MYIHIKRLDRTRAASGISLAYSAKVWLREARAGSRYVSTKSEQTEVLSCGRGYRVCKDRWAAAVGELLTCSRKPTDASVTYAVAVIKERTTIGHLPNNKISI